MRIRAEQLADRPSVNALNQAVFEGPTEAGLVDVLREQARPVISLVAEDFNGITGHIMFSPMRLDAYPHLRLMGLAPMAVLPEHQRTGIGSALVRAGIDECRRIGAVAVFVLGHPAYYPRFGFESAAGFGIDSEYKVSAHVFMALELENGALREACGTVKYHPAFDST